MPSRRPWSPGYAFAVIALVSCAMLMYEILLTRICALRLFFHFSFLVVSNCLLGIGASGSMISILQDRWRKRERFWIWLSTVLFLASLVVVYVFLIEFRVDPGVTFRTLEGAWRFAAFNLGAAVPFFFAGTAVGLVLTFNASQVNRAYFLDLVGAGLGCLLCPFLLWMTGAGGSLALIALIALAGAMIATPPAYRRVAVPLGAAAAVALLIVLPGVDRWLPVPSKAEIEVTPGVKLELARTRPYSRWSAISRVDLFPVEEGERFVFGRGRRPPRFPIPEEKFILQDGSAGTYILNFGEHPEALGLLERTTYSAAVRLKDEPRVFVMGVGGGADVWAAKHHGARSIEGVELNRQILDIHREVLPEYSRGIIEDPRIVLRAAEGRSALMRESGPYDVIQMTGVDTWTALTSGAYMLAENYLYTVEAVETMYDRLAPGGILLITRFAQGMETLRLLANISAALEARGVTDLEGSVVCLVARRLVTVLTRKGAFPDEELDRLDRFIREAGIDVLHHPRYRMDSLAAQFIRTDDKAGFIREAPRDISPTPDDRPYFFNYTRWEDLFAAAEHIDEPLHVSQGNPLFIFGQLAFSALLGLVLILVPLIVFLRRATARAHLPRFLVYFTGIGLGFIAIEIAMMQKLVLLVGHPLYSITVTLLTMLVFTGVGSLLSGRWFHAPTRHAWWVPLGILALVGTFVLLSPRIVTLFIGHPPPVRFLVAAAILAPLGLLLGVPFAYGIRLLTRFNPTIIPWAWAVNGCATVVGSVLTVILSMNLGFSFVLLAASATYFVVFASLAGLR